MQFKHWEARLALGALLFAGALACRTTDVFVAEATDVPTRTPRPTFTPLPSPTDTPEPTATFPPSPTPVPTRRPTARPTPRPPTPKPPPPPVAQPTTPQFRYKSANVSCLHSGQSFIQGTVYDKAGNHVNGVTVVMSGDSAGSVDSIADKQDSGVANDGMYSMIVNAFGASPGQKRWVWVLEGGQRASDIAEIDFNNLPDTNPATCWNGVVDFVQQY